ncbi:MAG: PIG-L family deacetylase [Chitinophagaceae bacterium]|nr:MAG: PIG-L family deacetylase [Chitinophagaceae bacterium]
MKKLLTVFLLFTLTAKGQEPAYKTSADIYLGLRKLNVLGSVLYIAAHPDDENTRLLTYFSKDRMYRTGYLSLTRGDGGQNLIGDEQGVELGLIRTQELLAARRIDGAEQFFSRAFDFGFSKTPVETFQKWDREKILSDVVWVIRKFRPDVIITRFPTTGEGGHGHHTASAILANEAFSAAADPKRFPEQLKWVQPWQARRILWNTFNFGSTNTTREDQHHFDVGGYNPILGKSYGEIAAESRSQHKSQGFGVPRQRGEALEYFKPTGGEPLQADLMDGVRLGWDRIPGGDSLRARVDALVARFDFMHPEASVEGLVQLYKYLRENVQGNGEPGYWREQKLEEVRALIQAASGLWLDAWSAEPFVVSGDSARVHYSINNRLGVPMTLNSIQIDNSVDTIGGRSLARNANLNGTLGVAVDSVYASTTQPYWLDEPMSEGMFSVSDQQMIGKPQLDNGLYGTAWVSLYGQSLRFSVPVRYRFTDPVKGELYQPFDIIPPLSVRMEPDVLLLSKDRSTEAQEVRVHVVANKTIAQSVQVELQSGAQRMATEDKQLQLARGAEKAYNFPLRASRDGISQQHDFNASVRPGDGSAPQRSDMRTISYNHIPTIRYWKQDRVRVLDIDLKTRGKKIGYIVGAGDKVPQALEQMGYEVTLLGEKELNRLNLKTFDAIISGVRAYNTAEWLNTVHPKLMKYVEDGGNLIVQYNTSNQIGPVRAKIGPYNFNITRNRITNEQAEVTLLKPDHPALYFPNKINASDFSGWIQERSIYHASIPDLDPHFEALLRMNDPGEAADDGALVVAKYGKGFFTYTGLVFFRELPAGVPGAYRLLANLIALNQKKEL